VRDAGKGDRETGLAFSAPPPLAAAFDRNPTKSILFLAGDDGEDRRRRQRGKSRLNSRGEAGGGCFAAKK